MIIVQLGKQNKLTGSNSFKQCSFPPKKVISLSPLHLILIFQKRQYHFLPIKKE